VVLDEILIATFWNYLNNIRRAIFSRLGISKKNEEYCLIEKTELNNITDFFKKLLGGK